MAVIYEAENHILINADYDNPIRHSHSAVHIIVSDYDMKANIEGKDHICKGIIIPSGEEHYIETSDKSALVFLYDSTTAVAGQINEVAYLEDEICREIIDMYRKFTDNAEEYAMFHKRMLEIVGITDNMIPLKDERIITAIDYIRNHISEKISCAQVADTVFLSQSRFSHLFRKHTGMTFAAYLIYQRLMYVYAKIINGKNITEAAYNAGFSSSSHFADVSRRVFGLTARAVTNKVKFVRIAEIQK